MEGSIQQTLKQQQENSIWWSMDDMPLWEVLTRQWRISSQRKFTFYICKYIWFQTQLRSQIKFGLFSCEKSFNKGWLWLQNSWKKLDFSIKYTGKKDFLQVSLLYSGAALGPAIQTSWLFKVEGLPNCPNSHLRSSVLSYKLVNTSRLSELITETEEGLAWPSSSQEEFVSVKYAELGCFNFFLPISTDDLRVPQPLRFREANKLFIIPVRATRNNWLSLL